MSRGSGASDETPSSVVINLKSAKALGITLPPANARWPRSGDWLHEAMAAQITGIAANPRSGNPGSHSLARGCSPRA